MVNYRSQHCTICTLNSRESALVCVGQNAHQYSLLSISCRLIGRHRFPPCCREVLVKLTDL